MLGALGAPWESVVRSLQQVPSIPPAQPWLAGTSLWLTEEGCGSANGGV